MATPWKKATAIFSFGCKNFKVRIQKGAGASTKSPYIQLSISTEFVSGTTALVCN